MYGTKKDPRYTKQSEEEEEERRRRRKKKKEEGTKLEILIFPDLKLQYKSMVIKPIWYWHNNSCIGQGNRIENAEINWYTYVQLTYDEGRKNFQ